RLDLAVGKRRHRALTLERRFDIGRELLRLARDALGFAFAKLAHHIPGEQLDRLHDMLVPGVAALLDEGELVDAGVVELADVRTQPGGIGDAAFGRRVSWHVRQGELKLFPEAGPPGQMLAEAVMPAERELEEAETL